MSKPRSFFVPAPEFERAGGRLAILIAPVFPREKAARDYILRAGKYTAARLSAATNKKESTHD